MDRCGTKRLLSATVMVAWALSIVPSARAAERPVCKDPSWAAARLPGFVISSCKDNAWVSMDVSLPGGTRTLQGSRSTVNYSLTDQTKDPTNEAAWRHYAEQGQNAGAKLVSDARGGWSAVLTRQTPQGELWYIYKHGSGNDKSTSSYTLITVQIAPLAQDVQVLETAAALDTNSTVCKEPPWLIKQFSYFRIDHCSNRDFDAIKVDLPGGQKTIAGHIQQTYYALTDSNSDPVAAAVWKNYVNALQQIGAKLVSDPKRIYQAVLTRNTTQGEFWYIYQHTGGNEESTPTYSLATVQIGGPAPKPCTLEVYGINFDFNKAILRPDSEPVLQQVLALFMSEPSYASEIGGHTDNVGQSDYNRTLSGNRAEAVKGWLTEHGVAASRLSTVGYGDSKALAPNNSDENRARNRRVELTRKGCRGS